MPGKKRDAESLQDLIDRSWRGAGAPLRAAWPEAHRMAADQLLSFCEGQRHCVLGVTLASGSPLLIPVSFHLAPPGTIWLPTGPGSMRLEVLRKNPRAAVMIGQAVSDHHRAVLARGPVELVASSMLPARVAREAGEKLGDLSWAEWWIRLMPNRLLGYDAGSEGSRSASPG